MAEDYSDEILEAELLNELDKDAKEMSILGTKAVAVSTDVCDEGVKEKVLSEERRIREMEIAVWAESQKLLGGEPTAEVLATVYNRLAEGKTLIDALDGICGIKMWSEWRKSYPAVLALEEQARAVYSNRLEQEILAIADQSERTRVGEVNRDKTMIEARQRIIDRNDRLTEARIKAQEGLSGSVMVPVQINVKYGKE